MADYVCPACKKKDSEHSQKERMACWYILTNLGKN